MDIDPDDFRNSFDFSCTGALLCTRAMIRGMLTSSGHRGWSVRETRYDNIYRRDRIRSQRCQAQFACSKFALRGQSQSVAREFQPMGIHVVHVRIDAILDVLWTREGMMRQYDADELGSTDDIADTYYALRRQSPLILSLPPSQANITG
jgi:NAD(P)-dependent dehydrogenase (short-subunit alcohol dehydrogenase family)